jgi:hypothetical protein
MTNMRTVMKMQRRFLRADGCRYPCPDRPGLSVGDYDKLCRATVLQLGQKAVPGQSGRLMTCR